MTILGHYLHPPRLLVIGIFKPLTTILIMILALLPGAFPGETYARLIIIGLFFCLLGDILLVLPSDQFLPGLGAFLAGLVCYALAFRGGALAPDFLWGLLVLSGVALAI